VKKTSSTTKERARRRAAPRGSALGPQNDCEWFCFLRHFLGFILEDVRSGKGVNVYAIELTLADMAAHDAKYPHVQNTPPHEHDDRSVS